MTLDSRLARAREIVEKWWDCNIEDCPLHVGELVKLIAQALPAPVSDEEIERYLGFDSEYQDRSQLTSMEIDRIIYFKKGVRWRERMMG